MRKDGKNSYQAMKEKLKKIAEITKERTDYLIWENERDQLYSMLFRIREIVKKEILEKYEK